MNRKNGIAGLIATVVISAGYLTVVAQDAVPHAGTIKQLPVDYTAHFQNQSHFDTLYQYAAMEFSFNGKTKADFLQWQSAFRPVLKEKLGLTTIEKQLPGYIPKVEKRNVEDKGGYLLERWLIWTEPTVPLPFVLLRPKNIRGKVPLVITPHGHGKNTESYAGVFTSEADSIFNTEGERDVAVQAVKQGYLAIAPTARAFGETRTQKDIKEDKTHSCHIQLMHDLLVGRTPIGDRVWDVSKIIDWAVQNLPVETTKIVVTGNSGGGTTTLFAAACDTRINIAVPASYFNTFTGSIGTLDHCDCNYIPGMLNMAEMSDVAGLIAPRPFCAVNGIKDGIYPIEEARKAFAHLKAIYAAAGVPEKCELYEGAEGHRYYGKGAWTFINKAL